MKIYNLQGCELKTIINQSMEIGTHELQFDASNFPSGIYFYQLQTNNQIKTNKMVLLK